MAHRLLSDPEQDGWERSDFPIVCETCLGPNPYVRMQRIEYGGTCHISARPYTVFRWRPGSEARYKKTIICQEVAKQKNVCQVCLLDLEYNLPVQVRDSALGVETEDIPESDVGKEFALAQRQAAGDLGSSFTERRPTDLINQLQRTTPYYKRNRAQICSFFVRGECTRGAECPYRHEMPTTGELADQNIKDRYYGVNDPVANKMLRRAAESPRTAPPPDDKSITTLWVGGVTADMTDNDLKDAFYSYGEVSSIRLLPAKKCAFVTFTTRDAAEGASEQLSGRLMVKGVRLHLTWGRAPAPDAAAPSTSGRPAMLPPHVQLQMQAGGAGGPPPGPNFFNLPPAQQAGAPALYPSMDPSSMGSRGRLSGEQLRPGSAAGPPEASGAGAPGPPGVPVPPYDHQLPAFPYSGARPPFPPPGAPRPPMPPPAMHAQPFAPTAGPVPPPRPPPCPPPNAPPPAKAAA